MNEAEIHVPLVMKGFKGRSETERVWMLSRFLGVTYTLFADSQRTHLHKYITQKLNSKVWHGSECNVCHFSKFVTIYMPVAIVPKDRHSVRGDVQITIIIDIERTERHARGEKLLEGSFFVKWFGKLESSIRYRPSLWMLPDSECTREYILWC